MGPKKEEVKLTNKGGKGEKEANRELYRETDEEQGRGKTQRGLTGKGRGRKRKMAEKGSDRNREK